MAKFDRAAHQGDRVFTSVDVQGHEGTDEERDVERSGSDAKRGGSTDQGCSAAAGKLAAAAKAFGEMTGFQARNVLEETAGRAFTQTFHRVDGCMGLLTAGKADGVAPQSFMKTVRHRAPNLTQGAVF
ncbi:hypothetical protein GOX01_19060 [Gluconobacter oxydans]|nr:hypothetical protein GOX01_19060 [Gluconobacter oxydans]